MVEPSGGVWPLAFAPCDGSVWVEDCAFEVIALFGVVVGEGDAEDHAAAVDEEADDLNAVDDACAAVSEEGVSVARFEGCAFWDGAVFVDKVEAVWEVQGVGLCRRLRELKYSGHG